MRVSQNLRITVFIILMVNVFVALLGMVVAGSANAAGPIMKLPIQIQKPIQIEPPYAACNNNCVDLKVTQSCKSNPAGSVFAEKVTVCTREDMRPSTMYKCNTYTDYCYPYTCDGEGKACMYRCYHDGHCMLPNRCIKQGMDDIGLCKVPTLTCNESILSDGFETVDCSPYRCTLDPFPRCKTSCGGTGDCKPGYICWQPDHHCIK